MKHNKIYQTAITPPLELTNEEKEQKDKLLLKEQEERELRHQWLQHPLTKRFINQLQEARLNILNECSNLADSLTEEQRAIVLGKLKETKTLNKVIDYANGNITNYSSDVNGNTY